MRSAARNTVRDWARLAVKLGLLFTEPEGRAEIGEQVKDRTEHLRNAITHKYEDAADRLEAAADALRGRRYWPSRVTGFLLGMGIGAGLGILLAPASGRETRDSIREKSAEMKNKAVDSARATAGKVRESVASMPSTGTGG